MQMKGIDVSQWQGTEINFNKVKAAGYSFVIIRAGYGRSAGQKDPCFETNYKKAKAAGLKVGAYWYSYADSADDARTEAAAFISIIRGKTFEMPLYFDLEEQKQFARGRAFCSELVKAFCNELEAAGFWAGLYISRSYLQNYITTEVANRYALWVAEYNSRCNYGGTYGMWQYSSTGRVDGINTDVDLNYCYIDYPAEIVAAGLNGYKKQAAKPQVEKKPEAKPQAEKKPAKTEEKKKTTYTTYTVKKGDTLWGISQKYKTTVDKLVEINKIKNPDLIYAGQKIKIPK